jgi:glycerol-3-phosphate acyltransferase PlsY
MRTRASAGKEDERMAARGALCLAVAYLVGSFPSAYVVSRLMRGLDIRRIGDGNIGAHNTYCEIGPGAGILVAMLDIIKGSAAVALARQVGLSKWWELAAGGAAVLGHDFMLFLGFEGGQGMAASIGALLVVLPGPTLIGLCIAGLTWLFLRLKHRFNWSMAVGLGSIPLLAWLTGEPGEKVWYPVALLPLIGVRKLMSIRSTRRSGTTPDGEVLK